MVKTEMNYKTIRVYYEKEWKEYSWEDVERLSLSRLIFPPFYTIKFKEEERAFYFISSKFGFGLVPIFVWDWSDMGAFIKDQKKLYDI